MGVMGKLAGWREAVPPNGQSDPGLFKVSEMWVINEQRQNGLTGVISSPVLSLKTSNLQRLLSQRKKPLHTCVCVCARPCSDTDALKGVQGHGLRRDRWACHMSKKSCCVTVRQEGVSAQ